MNVISSVFAAKLIQVNDAPILIAKLEVRNRIALSRHVIHHRGPIIRLALGDHHDVIQQNTGIGPLRNQHVSRNNISRMQFAQDVRILELVGHCHRVHKAGDGFMIQRDLARRRVVRDDLPAQFVDFIGSVGCGILRPILLTMTR